MGDSPWSRQTGLTLLCSALGLLRALMDRMVNVRNYKGESMITKRQAMELRHGDELHYTGNSECRIVVGPRGGETENIMRVRVSGQCQTWKRDTERFRLPVKYGLYESSAIEPSNAHKFHLPEDCNPPHVKGKSSKGSKTTSRPYYPQYGIV